MPTTGDRIREIREHKGWNQDYLADKAKISKGFLSDVENNKKNISSELLLRVANALGASVDYLLRGEAGEERYQQVVIPPELSEAAEKYDWSYSETLNLLNAYNSVVGRRTNKLKREFTVTDWKNLYDAIKGVFGL